MRPTETGWREATASRPPLAALGSSVIAGTMGAALIFGPGTPHETGMFDELVRERTVPGTPLHATATMPVPTTATTGPAPGPTTESPEVTRAPRTTQARPNPTGAAPTSKPHPTGAPSRTTPSCKPAPQCR